MGKKFKIGKKITALIIIVLVFAAISGLHLLGVFHYLEYKSYDLRVRFWAASTYSRPSDEIALILLDQHSLDWAQQERGWGWPWPRQAYAEITDFMNLAGARTAAFDVIFSEPSVYRSVMQDDAAFASAAENYGNVVQTVVFSSQTGNASSWPSGLDVPLFQPVNFGSMLDRFGIGEGEKGQFPIQELRNSAAAIGCVTGRPDSDGIIRRLKPFYMFDGKAVPSFAAASLLASGYSNQITYNEKTGYIEWNDERQTRQITIPIDKNGNVLLRYRGDLDRYIPIRASAILQSLESVKNGENPVLDPANFKDTHVFFGVYAQGLFDIFVTPISSVYPGVGGHMTMLDNMLQGDFIRESSEAANLLILLAVVVLIVLLTMFSHRIPLTLTGTIIIIAAVIAGAFAAYQFGGLWVPMITFIAGILASFITVTLYNFATEGQQKRFIKSAFSRYLSPKVIEQLIQDPSQLNLGGEKREMTAIFTDVRGFSTFSEALGDPTKLVELLNFYLTRMSNIVLDNQGTIDKYEGDAIIAFFGAPIHFNNHAALACRAAIGMKKAEPQINHDAIENGLVTREVMEAMLRKGLTKSVDDPCQIFTRIGINTGDMVVGNMGTPNKMDYTIMGNAVNLAARLEGVNKQYDTGGILISEYTRAHLGDEFVLRPLSRVRVVGINTPLRLYELLDIASEASGELLSMVKSWEQAFELYEKRDFKAAQTVFQTICKDNDADKAAKKYLNRCEKYISSPPDEKAWDNGVDNLTEK